MRDYLSPERNRAALLTIDAQRDFALPDAPARVGGTMAAVPAMQRLTAGFREKGAPIIHVIRLYRCDGSNVELCRRAAIEEGRRIVMPGSSGAELVDGLRPPDAPRLDAELLLSGQMQALGPAEWVLYRPRWGAFYGTTLEAHLRGLAVSTLVIAGCNFPSGPRATVYEASDRDFRIVLATDAVSGATEEGLCELGRMGVYLMASGQCREWMQRGGQAAA